MNELTRIDVDRQVRLRLYEEMCRAIAQASAVDEVKAIHDRALAIEIYAKQAKNLEAEVQARSIRLRAERKAGQLLATMDKAKGAREPGTDRGTTRSHDATASTLADLGISKDQSSRWQKLAKVSEEQFEEWLSGIRIPTTAAIVREVGRDRPEESKFSPIIKPMDNWNFSPVKYDRIDEEAGHGYIPGELYANCLWYYTQPNDLVVAPMAGGGQIMRVYEDRHEWARPEPWDLDLRLFDLNPRGPYEHLIEYHDLTTGFPTERADYIVMDIPYFGMVEGQYSDKSEDIANMDLDAWTSAIHAIAASCAFAQSPNSLCTVITPNYRDVSSRAKVMATRIVEKAFETAGYRLYDLAYASRHVQQAQNAGMAILNNKAKQNRIMLTDIAEVMTFARARRTNQ